MNQDQDRERIIGILQRNNLLCISESDVCYLSERFGGCQCGKIMEEIRSGS